MAKKGSYASRISDTIRANVEAAGDTYTQFTADLFILALNDPEIMGKDVFGKARIKRVTDGVMQKYEYYKAAVECGRTRKEQEKNDPVYYREKLDQALRRILGEEDFVEFEKRYPWLQKIRF